MLAQCAPGAIRATVTISQIAGFGLKEGSNALKEVGDEITVTCTPAADGKSPVGLHAVRFRSPDE